MPITINCPSCSRTLRVPDDLLGKNVKCPTCGTTFTASAEAPPPEEEEPAARAPARAPAPPPDDDEERDERRPRRLRRSSLEPHRGPLVLVLGILGLLVFAPLGIVAWVLGNNDLKEMRAGRMDPEGESLTNAGRICGIIATIFMIGGVLVFACAVFGLIMMAVLSNNH
jgi:predicted Zn finger-like uncharacterized protein